MDIKSAGSWAKRVAWDDVHPITAIAQDRLITEVASWGVFLGAGMVMTDNPVIQPVKDVLAKAITPFVGVGDKVMDTMQALEDDQEMNARKAMSRKDRAKLYADKGLNLMVSFTSSLVMQNLMQEALDTSRGVNHVGPLNPTLTDRLSSPYFWSALADKAVTIGAAYAINNGELATINENYQEKVQAVLEKAGVPKERADTLGKTVTNLLPPNIAGMATSVGILAACRSR